MEIPERSRPMLAARARVQDDRVTGKPMLVYPEGVLILNPSGSAIVALCDGTRTFDEIVSALAARHQAPVEAVSADVRTYLLRLHERKLVEFLSELESGPK